MANKAFIVRFFSIVNVLSSVGYILVSRYLANLINCKCSASLLSAQYLTGWLILEFLAYEGNFSRNTKIPIQRRLIVALLLFGQGFLQYSVLMESSIGMLQLTKAFSITTLIIITITSKIKRIGQLSIIHLSLFVVGTFIAFYTDLDFGIVKMLKLTITSFLTSISHVYVSQTITDYGVTGTQLSISCLPFQFMYSIFVSILFETDPIDGFYAHRINLVDIIFILLTCITNVWTQLSEYTIIGETASYNYELLGAFKSLIIIVASYFIFPAESSTIKFILEGVGLILIFLGWYLSVFSKVITIVGNLGYDL